MDAELKHRLKSIDWSAVTRNLDAKGVASIGSLLTASECRDLALSYERDGFRNCVVMARHGFGRGEYKYFDYPLPPLIDGLRGELHRHLASLANAWHERMNVEPRFPAQLEAMIRRCHAAGQARPTPLLLRYGTGDYNCLHQDLYGDHVFPLQVVVLLSKPEAEFDGGEFVVVELSVKP